MRSLALRSDQKPASGFASGEVFEGFITEDEYARQRGVSVRTCQRDRALRNAPPHVVMGRIIYYRVEAIREWLISQERMAGQRSTKSRQARLR